MRNTMIRLAGGLIAYRQADRRARKLARAYREAGRMAVTHAWLHQVTRWPCTTSLDGIYQIGGSRFQCTVLITVNPCQEVNDDTI